MLLHEDMIRNSAGFRSKHNLPFFEYGDWTPTLAGMTTAGTPTYAAQEGKYQRVGNWVFLTCYLVTTAKNDISGQIIIGGQPMLGGTLEVEGRSILVPSFWSGLTLPAGTTNWVGFLQSSAGFRLYRSTLTSGTGPITDAELAPSSTIYANASYPLTGI